MSNAKMTLMELLLFSCFICLSIGNSACGNGVFEKFNEECDGGDGCDSECFCESGYTPDGEGNCVISCMYGDACLTGCVKPDVCGLCDTSMGYKEDCSGCLNGSIWFGEGNCAPYDNYTILSCGSFFDVVDPMFEGKPNPFHISVGTADSVIGENGKVSFPELNLTQYLGVNSCSRYVDPTQPFAFGYYVELFCEYETYISIEVDKKYSHSEIVNYDKQQIAVGTPLAVSAQDSCPSATFGYFGVKCLSSNGGFSDYVKSPRLITRLMANSPQYLFVHSKYSENIIPAFDLFINDIVHSCSSNYVTIEKSQIANGGFTTNLNLEHTIESRSICSSELRKGYWFRIEGSSQTVDISTCDSQSNYDINLDLLSFKLEDYGYDYDSPDILNVDCDETLKTKCVKTRSDGCGDDSHLSRMIVKLEIGNTYLLFVGINEEYGAYVNLTITQTCPQDCGEHGVCSSYSGQCECLGDYVMIGGICTLCGNGKLDEGEECDPSVEGYRDSKCSNTCNCEEGYGPMEINGIIKCAIPTCGNGKVDDYEECDGGFGCDHCVCVNGTKKYAQARTYCMSATCGNKQWDKGEECDGGDGCIECECQENWFTNKAADCSTISPSLKHFFYWGTASISYFLLFISLLFIVFFMYVRLTNKIKREMEDEKLTIFENVVIPFDKTNSQYIDLRQENPYFSFSSNSIEFGDIRPEIDEPIETHITLTNNWKYPMHFTFHSGDYTKYEITCKPFTGTIKPKESVELTITFMAKCTTLLNEKVPITIRYGQLQNMLKDIKKENPELIAHCSQSSQNSESDKHSQSSGPISQKNSQPSSNQKSQPSKSSPSGSGKSDSNSSKKKKGKSKVSKFHVYLNLQIESALSTKLDYEEIHLQHPSIGGGTFGNVYRAEWRRVDVAVKVMKTDLVGLADLLPNFMQEAEMMERIRCPYIVNFIGSVATSDTLCLVTEFCPLGSLRKFMKTNAMPDLLKVRFCQDIAKGMEYLHQNDILHRDLKTDNVLVYSKNPNDPITAKVTDFGTSRSFIESSDKIALQNIGTPVYMAPEINRKDQMTLKSDVFSFAICMLEVWIGKDPYDPVKFPDSESILKFIGAAKRLDIPNDCLMKSVIEKAWKHKASERPTFKEVGNELDAIYKKVSDKQKLNSNKEHSGSTKTGTKSKDISSSERKTEPTNKSTSKSNTTNEEKDESKGFSSKKDSSEKIDSIVVESRSSDSEN